MAPSFQDIARREAIAWAWQDRQIKQFMQLHMDGARVAFAQGRQGHEHYLEDDRGEPVGLMGRGVPWTQGIQWLLQRGWEPTPVQLATLLTPARVNDAAYMGQQNDCEFIQGLIRLPHMTKQHQAHAARMALLLADGTGVQSVEATDAARRLMKLLDDEVVSLMDHLRLEHPALEALWATHRTRAVRAQLETMTSASSISSHAGSRL